MRAVLVALLVTGCRINLDHGSSDGNTSGGMCQTSTASACVAAVGHSDLTWIQANIFDKQCTFSGCHNGANTAAGKLDLRAGMAYAHLVNYASVLEPARKLVVPGNPKQSYLTVMLGMIKPAEADPPAGPVRADVGLMPMDNNGDLLCCQKLDAIDQWITAGAMNN